MKNIRNFIWPLIGIAAVILSCWLLYRELHTLSLHSVVDSLKAIPHHNYLMAIISTLAAYAALAWYDRIALLHLGVKNISLWYVSVTSFTTYALSHNIGASVFSGAIVRYRAYSVKGLSATQIAILVGLCSFTFALGVIILAGVVLIIYPHVLIEIVGKLSEKMGGGSFFTKLYSWFPSLESFQVTDRTLFFVGVFLLLLVALYALGSLTGMRPLQIRSFRLEYPRPAVMLRQLIAGPLELLGAAGIIYFALPGESNPGFIVVLAVFLASFSAGLLSHAPGGLGVFELIFTACLSNIPQQDVIAAVLVFRLLYLLLPFALSIIVVVLHEKASLTSIWKRRFHLKPNNQQ
ncbi:lysylphosphatidylglycerol synthase domain-containing protein [Microvirga sp. W0021]|uniref:Lysylphosphatidylglycerol synthase domain-containing protein n=1 Tax=Hohaiivirga grylli TaxID=3133970 RepID=A0ABV0BH89_9HYPH